MKSIILFVGVLFSSVLALAMPKIGDSSTFDLMITPQGQAPMAGQMTMTITQYNAQNKQYLAHIVLDLGGKHDEGDEWHDADRLLTDAKVAQFIQYCSYLKGKIEHIAVPAGQFHTCALPVENDDSSGTIWIGQAPYGLVKSHSTSKKDNSVTDLALRSFQFGK